MLLKPKAALRTGVNSIRRLAGAAPLDEDVSLRTAAKQGGQIVVIFALMLTVLIGLVGIAIDTTYAWRESLRVQRAADAAALAGVVYMPGAFDVDPSTNDATDKARQEAAKNGFPHAGSTVVTPSRATNTRELDVTITTPVPTFFSRIFGINSFTVSRSSKAVYVTPVPMGSPLAYYGVYQLQQTNMAVNAEPSPNGVTVASQGFFGAIEGQGSSKQTGDAFATYYNGSYSPTNTQYNADGYRYEIQAVNSGKVYLFDPEFCPTSGKTAGGHAGAGDHWLGNNMATSTYYILWNTHNTPLAPSTWTNVAELDENNPVQVDKSTAYGTGSYYTDWGDTPPSSAPDCANDAHHNKWVAMGNTATGTTYSLVAGTTYSLQVTTTKPGFPNANLNQNFENMFSIAVSGTGATVHGTGSMVTYANVDSGSQEFYLAQIDRTAGAGKTIEIDLFDVGDVSAPSWVQIEPDGSPAWQPTTFSYQADANGGNRSNGSTNCLQAYGGSGGSPPTGCLEKATTGNQFFQNSWVTIMVTLPSTYGDATHPLLNNGWWKIKYTVSNGNDTTTWQVSIKGNPVHLI